ncbi:MAG: hypothetical protein ACQES5_06770 [Thermodesulfobacteriota bacterium]
MQSELNELGADGLVFFGQINASISHELKNVLATVYETAGLMDDLIEIAQEEGNALDVDHTRKLCARILHQIRRGNGIIKNMNSFAHSVDEPLNKIDTGKMTEFMLSLCERFAALRECKLVRGEMESVDIQSDPFLLELLLFRAILFALNNVDEAREITVSAAFRNNGACFDILGMKPVESGFPEETMTGLKNALKAEVSLNSDKNGICICLPEILDNPPRFVRGE